MDHFPNAYKTAVYKRWGNSWTLMACGCWWKRCRNGPQFGNLVVKGEKDVCVVVILFLMFEEWNAVLTDLWQTWGVPFFLGEKLDSDSRKKFKRTKFYFGIVMYRNPAPLSVSPTTWRMQPTHFPAFYPQTHPDPLCSQGKTGCSK